MKNTINAFSISFISIFLIDLKFLIDNETILMLHVLPSGFIYLMCLFLLAVKLVF
mgnify:CR=1 FL=1